MKKFIKIPVGWQCTRCYKTFQCEVVPFGHGRVHRVKEKVISSLVSYGFNEAFREEHKSTCICQSCEFERQVTGI